MRDELEISQPRPMLARLLGLWIVFVCTMAGTGVAYEAGADLEGVVVRVLGLPFMVAFALGGLYITFGSFRARLLRASDGPCLREERRLFVRFWSRETPLSAFTEVVLQRVRVRRGRAWVVELRGNRERRRLFGGRREPEARAWLEKVTAYTGLPVGDPDRTPLR